MDVKAKELKIGSMLKTLDIETVREDLMSMDAQVIRKIVGEKSLETNWETSKTRTRTATTIRGISKKDAGCLSASLSCMGPMLSMATLSAAKTRREETTDRFSMDWTFTSSMAMVETLRQFKTRRKRSAEVRRTATSSTGHLKTSE